MIHVRRARFLLLGLASLLGMSSPTLAIAQDDDGATLRALERRVQELEEAQEQAQQSAVDEEPSDTSEPETTGSSLSDWANHVRLGGSANVGYYGGQNDSPLHEQTFAVWDARFFIDAELGEDVVVADTTLVRNVGFSFEWDLVRLGNASYDDVGELYVDFQALGDSPYANVQLGRFMIPVGEAYLNYSRGYSKKFFITNTVGGPWWWDEGLRIYGGDPKGLFGYVASVSDGETAFNTDQNEDPQGTLKLWIQPTSWLHLSISGLISGTAGSRNSAGQGALWLGEMWARAFGSGSSVSNYVDGVVTADGPNRLDETYLLAADVIIDRKDQFRLWLAYGTYAIDQKGTTYDRRLHYWIAEFIVHGGWISPAISDFYVGVRADGLGTYDGNEGYLLDSRYNNKLGYNMEAINAYSAVAGWQMLRGVTLRTEYSHADIDLVKGVPRSISRKARSADSWAVEVGVAF